MPPTRRRGRGGGAENARSMEGPRSLASQQTRRGHMGNLVSFFGCLFVLLIFVVPAIAQIAPRIGGGEGFTCAMGASGRAFCWGSNTSGQIGNGAGMANTSRVSTPVEM